MIGRLVRALYLPRAWIAAAITRHTAAAAIVRGISVEASDRKARGRGVCGAVAAKSSGSGQRSSWPNSKSTVERVFAGVSDDDRDLVCRANAARVWNL